MSLTNWSSHPVGIHLAARPLSRLPPQHHRLKDALMISSFETLKWDTSRACRLSVTMSHVDGNPTSCIELPLCEPGWCFHHLERIHDMCATAVHQAPSTEKTKDPLDSFARIFWQTSRVPFPQVSSESPEMQVSTDVLRSGPAGDSNSCSTKCDNVSHMKWRSRGMFSSSFVQYACHLNGKHVMTPQLALPCWCVRRLEFGPTWYIEKLQSSNCGILKNCETPTVVPSSRRRPPLHLTMWIQTHQLCGTITKKNTVRIRAADGL